MGSGWNLLSTVKTA